ncbi:TLDc domain-containing protein [Entamoeba marina]
MNELDNMETERFSELKQVEEEPKKGGRRGFGYSEIEKEEQSEEEYLEEEEQSEEEYLEEEEQSEEEYSEEEEQSEEYLEEEEQSEEEYLEEEEQSEEEDLEEEEQSEEVKGGKRGFRERPRYGQKGFRGRPRYGQRGYGGRRYPTRECEKKKMEKVSFYFNKSDNCIQMLNLIKDTLFVQLKDIVELFNKKMSNQFSFTPLDTQLYEKKLVGSYEEVKVQYQEMYDTLGNHLVNSQEYVGVLERLMIQLEGILLFFQKICDSEHLKMNKIAESVKILTENMIEASRKAYEEEKEKQEQRALDVKKKVTKVTDKMIQTSDNVAQIKQLAKSYKYFKEWSQKEKCTIIYDSNVQNKALNQSFNNKLLNKNNLFIVNFDKNNNVFGVFLKDSIKTIGITNQHQSFIFSLKTGDVVDRPMMWKLNDGCYSNIQLFENEDILYQIGESSGFTIYKVGMNESYCFDLSLGFKGIEDDDLTNSNYEEYVVERIIVLEMK